MWDWLFGSGAGGAGAGDYSSSGGLFGQSQPGYAGDPGLRSVYDDSFVKSDKAAMNAAAANMGSGNQGWMALAQMGSKLMDQNQPQQERRVAQTPLPQQVVPTAWDPYALARLYYRTAPVGQGSLSPGAVQHYGSLFGGGG